MHDVERPPFGVGTATSSLHPSRTPRHVRDPEGTRARGRERIAGGGDLGSA